MNGAEVAAWLALVVASGSLGWQILESRRRRTSRVDVEVHHVALSEGVPDPELVSVPALGLDARHTVWPAADGERLTYVLAVVAVNHGETTESVEDLRVVSLDGTMASGASQGGDAQPLPPRDRVTWAFRPARAEWDMANGFYAIARLGTSEVVTGPHHLDRELAQLIDQHNESIGG